MASKGFFEERTEESQAKAEIVDKYFRAWARVVGPHARAGKIAYIDLFSGPGRYKDGAASVPILIVENAIKDEFLRDRLVTVFNDIDKNNTSTLEVELANLPNVQALKNPPIVYTNEVGTEIIKQLGAFQNIPTLFFVDPWGYKGLSLKLINSVLQNWGCDCIFFFNYNRINMGLNNAIVQEHMDALFGADRANELRMALANKLPDQRELTIIEELSQALKNMGGNYVLPFCFRNEEGTRTSHYLIFVSKNIRGYTIMKDVMAGISTLNDQGVPSFAYCQADKNTPLLFELSRPLDELGKQLLRQFAGMTVTMKQIYDAHHVGRPFIEKNYKRILLLLEQQGKIVTEPSQDKRRKDTFGPAVRVTFPKGEANGG